MNIRSYREWTPLIGRGAWVDPAATVIGRVTIGDAPAGAGFEQGAKGVDGGAVRLTGRYRD